MAVRTIHRARAPAIKVRRPARRPQPPRGGSPEGRLSRRVALETGEWVRISSSCERCGALYVVCLNTMQTTETPALCPSEGLQCEWRHKGTHIDSGDYPWLVGMEGAFGPGDEFAVDEPERLFIGGHRKRGEWRTVQPGRWTVRTDGSLARVTA